ncbi:MAG: tripartite tricarboxylate transporter TctB family protein [Bauldia sp.]|uniref:tripartite tricarboxylate transporter TctB family protein n=1 Tax=Bauldia sp. TaxID=2575872 RepID=UPI001D5C3885|nr:tripartite tricarboxylate transporter TctB family protein [Bauldia sp.]MCB1497342.1 tripartite tricarboxylate transporter TctB family protein [Bauldia sp.]
MSDRVFGVVCILLAAFFIWQATEIETGFIVDPLGPSAFPIIVGVVLGVGGIYPIVRPDPAPDWPAPARLLEIVFAVAVMIAYAMVLPRIGFVVATAVAAGLLGWRLGSGPVAAAVGGVAIAVGIYVVFHLILGLSLARGPWGF